MTASEMREVEAAAARGGVSPDQLLAQAGAAVADRLATLYGRDRFALVLVGKGNNGGDGLVAAHRLATRHAWRLVVAVVTGRRPDDHAVALTAAGIASRVDVVTYGPEAGPWEAALDRALVEADVVLDGVLGIGVRGDLRGPAGAILARCGAVAPRNGQRRVSIDVPSGVDADTGAAALGAFVAARTLSTGPVKVGCLVGAGAAHAGRVDELDIGLPPTARERDAPERAGVPDDGATWRIGASDAAKVLPRRPDHSHKGTFGRVLVVGGSSRYPGAPVLASLGAIHAGAGLVTVARPGAAASAPLPPEAVTMPLGTRETEAFEPEQVEGVAISAADARAVVVGPGLGTRSTTIAAVRELLRSLPKHLPTVIDADGLNALAGTMDDERTRGGTWVMTPHAAEMARLTGTGIDTVLADPAGVARSAARRWGAVVVLKGAPSVVASPRGTVAIGAHANAALSTAGSGDVMAGAIGALLAQGADAWEAATGGVTLLAVAAETWRRANGNAGARASEIASAIPAARRFMSRLA